MHRIKLYVKSLLKIKWTVFVYLFLGLLIFAWLIAIAIAPFNKLKQIQHLTSADSAFTVGFDSIYFHPDMANLVKERAYMQALLQLSEDDSIQLVVNLSDSTVNLSMKGIIIHQAKISEFTRDKLYDKLSLDQEIKLFSRPLSLQHQYATIVKEPVVIRQAPKDTMEAALNAWQPDTLIQNPAYASFTFEHNIQLVFEQDENKSFRDKWERYRFYSHLKTEKVKTSTTGFFCFRKQEYSPELTIKIPVDDLRAIYRALPNHAYVVLKL